MGFKKRFAPYAAYSTGLHFTFTPPMNSLHQPIGIFDSGFGGLTVFRAIREALPDYDYIYLGDNARAPYGNRSFETVYQYTLQCVRWLFAQGCPLIILACNTASAKALRTIQQKDLPRLYPDKRVLGVIRPTAEVIGEHTENGVIGIMATKGTVLSRSYEIEIKNFLPHANIYQQACPMWVPLVENNEHHGPGAAYFIKKYIDELLEQAPDIDTILLACTHYPLLEKAIRAYLPKDIRLLSQGSIVASSLKDYLHRHRKLEAKITRKGGAKFYTTDNAVDFEQHGASFFGQPVKAEQIYL